MKNTFTLLWAIILTPLLIIGIYLGYVYIGDFFIAQKLKQPSEELSKTDFLSKCKWQLIHSDSIIENNKASLRCVVEVQDRKEIIAIQSQLKNDLKTIDWSVNEDELDGTGLRFGANKKEASVWFNLAGCSAGRDPYVEQYGYCLGYVELHVK